MGGGAAAELVRATVRPAVTWCLVAGQVGLAVLWAVGYSEAREAAAMLGPFTMMASTFYFKSRDEAHASARDELAEPRASMVVGAAK
ncbi:MAG: hypothetical protein WC211_07905 [Dehalococcoidia bacterium]